MSRKIKVDIPVPAAGLSHIEDSLREKGFHVICGVDEVGRGPLAGPVVAAAVVIPPGINIPGLKDSKKLSGTRRDELFEEMVHSGITCAVGVINHEQIDRMNILRASLVAMRKAVMELKISPDIVLVDGDYPIPNINLSQLSIVNGDNLCCSVAAASIIAKVTRDRIMDRYQAIYPSYSFSQHKGYSTPTHLEELRMHGPCEIHRKSFKPVADIAEKYALLEEG